MAYKNVSVPINFSTLGMTEAIAAGGLKAYIEKVGEEKFKRQVAKVFGKKAIPVAGWVIVALDVIAGGLQCAGYTGFEFVTKCLVKTTTKHQAGNTFTVTTCQPLLITDVKLIK